MDFSPPLASHWDFEEDLKRYEALEGEVEARTSPATSGNRLQSLVGGDRRASGASRRLAGLSP